MVFIIILLEIAIWMVIVGLIRTQKYLYLHVMHYSKPHSIDLKREFTRAERHHPAELTSDARG